MEIKKGKEPPAFDEILEQLETAILRITNRLSVISEDAVSVGKSSPEEYDYKWRDCII